MGRMIIPEAPFCQVPRSLAQNTNLSLEAIGLVTYLLSKGAGWRPLISDIEKQWKIGRERRQRIYAELEAEGYFERVTVQDEKGQWTCDVHLHLDPLPAGKRTKGGAARPRRIGGQIRKPGTGKPSPGKPTSVQPSPGKPTPVKPSAYMNKRSTEYRDNKNRDIGAAPVDDELFKPVSDAEKEYLENFK